MLRKLHILFKSIVLVEIAFYLLSCNSQNSKNSDIGNKDSSVSQATTNSDNKFGQKNETSNLPKIDDYPKSDKPMLPEKLEKFLPVKISGMEKAPSNKGLQNWDGKLCTTASSEYIYQGGGLIIYLKDYGKKENIPSTDMNDFKTYTEQIFPDIEVVRIPYGKGFMQYDKSNRTGVLNALVADRFIIKLDITNLPKTYFALYDLLDKIKIYDLIMSAKERKTN